MIEHKSPPSIAVVDVETTGLFPARHDRVVEVGIVVMQPDGRISAEFESLVNPMRDLGPTSIHGINAENVLKAPRFEDIAGHVLDALKGSVALAGHNVRFDNQFLRSEFERLGCDWPTCKLICTMELAGGGSLEECCNTYGVRHEGRLHNALADARAASHLLSTLLLDDPIRCDKLSDAHPIQWPHFDGPRKPGLTRSVSSLLIASEVNYLQRLLRRRNLHALPEASDGASLAYGALLDRALEDRRLEEIEAEALVETATKRGLDNDRVEQLHWDYLQQLVVAALADGELSNAELADLKRVARVLGKDEGALENAIRDAVKKLNEPKSDLGDRVGSAGDLRGLKVCFTGELQEQIAGNRISRHMAESLAQDAGLIVVNAVTKGCDLLVLADPNSQSGKAKMARKLGIRILHESVFFRRIGVTSRKN